mmetsp:Transcript_18856/g.47619  ORF Transcript_18856/g.47619 Transcript_18856/m.47619 type:complete len:254 (+) Transcript_18856:1224-1985(+)
MRRARGRRAPAHWRLAEQLPVVALPLPAQPHAGALLHHHALQHVVLVALCLLRLCAVSRAVPHLAEGAARKRALQLVPPVLRVQPAASPSLAAAAAAAVRRRRVAQAQPVARRLRLLRRVPGGAVQDGHTAEGGDQLRGGGRQLKQRPAPAVAQCRPVARRLRPAQLARPLRAPAGPAALRASQPPGGGVTMRHAAQDLTPPGRAEREVAPGRQLSGDRASWVSELPAAGPAAVHAWGASRSAATLAGGEHFA